MDITAATVIASIVPGLDTEGASAIYRAFGFLGISISAASGPDAKPKLSIPLDNHSSNDGHSRVEYDLGTQRWEVTPTCTKLKQEINGLLTAPQVKRRSSHEVSPDRRPKQPKEKHGDVDVDENDDEDWTKQISPTEHNKLLLSRNWEGTSLGPMSKWSHILRLMTLKMLSDPRPANLYWGKDRVAIYNEPFAVMACSRHPTMLGSTAEEALPVTWPFLGPMMEGVERSRQAFSLPEFEMEVHKDNGFLEEAWYNGIFSPIQDTAGNFVGLYNSGYEITNSVLMHRYGRLVHQIAAIPDFAQTTPWKHIVDACETFERDVPLLVVYSADMKETSRSNRCVLRLEGSLGVPDAHKSIPNSYDLNNTNDHLSSAFRSCKTQGCPILLEMSEGKLPDLFDGVKWRGWKQPSTHVVVMPIFTTGLISGFIVMGLNVRRPYDDDLRQLVNDVWRMSTSIVSSSISFAQAREREDLLTRELTEKEKFIRKLAEIATVGIYSISQSGALTYANKEYYEMIGTPKETQDGQTVGFEHFIFEDDVHKITKAHEECRTRRVSVSIEVRLRRTWTPPGTSTEEQYWVLNSIIPDEEDGEFQGVIGSLTDIRHTMWALRLQKESTEAVLESKQKLERFIDMTSHEMRNPLGAITQCADDISRSIDEGIVLDGDASELSELLEAIRDNAKTILFCSAHQKTIADDILMVSKLGSSLLTISPSLNQPAVLAKEVVRMFQAETANSKIELTFVTDKTYDLTWVSCDASRVRQILINLVSNAIKFTKGRDKRDIRIIMGASTRAPPAHMSQLKWYPKDAPPLPNLSGTNEVFLTFEVQDTGKGMTREEMSQLFNRFAQASPATSAAYGGSGLGLFISMQLTELQGGRIGLSSKSEEGSVFGFCIKVRKATASEKENKEMGGISESLKENNIAPRKTSQIDILLVEDNVVNQRVLSRQLRKGGHRVHIANHGVEALDFLRTTRYWKDGDGAGVEVDVILMDWEMPVMDGLECTKRIRELEGEGKITERLPIIITTANTRDEQKQKAFSAGTDKFLAKPFTVASLIDLIKSDD